MKFVLLLLVVFSVPWAHSLLNLNVEDRLVYDTIEASPYSKKVPLSIKPFNLLKVISVTSKPERVKEYLNLLSRPAFFIKPINSLTFEYIHSQEEYLIENSAGKRIFEGDNIYTFFDGYLSLGTKAVVYYQGRYQKNRYRNILELHRLYGKVKFWKFSLLAGKDAVQLGPGEYAIILSANAEPFPMVRIQTEKPLEFLGKWDLIFLRGWLTEERKDRDNPNILALRIVWKPADFLEVGAIRASMYGGEGLPDYRIEEYPKLIIGEEENIPGSRYNTDGYGAYDITLYLPVGAVIPSVKVFKLYFQEAGTDIEGWWQKEDRGKFYFPFGFKFLKPGFVGGVFVSTDNHIMRLEFTKASNFWYIHGLYPVEGYTYRGMSLGHPYGRDVVHVFFKHRVYFSDTFSAGYTVGYYEVPWSLPGPHMKRSYIKGSLEKRLRYLIITAFVRNDRTQNYDSDPSPAGINIVNEDKNFYTLGGSISWRF